MNLEEGILSRRSIRKYQKNSRVSKKDVDDILNMAMHAPSAANSQPWEFILIDAPNLLEKIATENSSFAFAKDAGLAVLVCGNVKEQYKEIYWTGDCAAATENMLLGAHAKGLGGCWCGVYPVEERMNAFKKMFSLPEHILPFALVVIGYPDEAPKQPHDRFKPAKIHHNGW